MSHCIYCNSTVHGRPCIFSPTNTHVHFDSPGKCIYCGSKMQGSGCIFNPFGKNHVRAPEFLAGVKEQTEKSTILKYLYEQVNKLQHSPYMSPLNRFYKRLYEIVCTSGQPLLEALQLQSKPTYSNLDKKQNLYAHELKERLSTQYKQIYETIKHANLSLPQEIVEEILVDAIMLVDENK